METILETNKVRVDFLYKLRKSYRLGDFSFIYSFLDENCVFESQWVLEPKKGFNEIYNYFENKGATLTEHNNFPHGDLVELVGDMNLFGNVGMTYEPGEVCLMLKQKVDDKENKTLVRVQVKGEKISRIDLCMPEFFKVRDFSYPFDFFPSNGNEDDNTERRICINESYLPTFYLFLGTEDFEFDEYDDIDIPMEIWINTLIKWKTFCESENFDLVLENLAGLNYSDWSCEKPKFLDYLMRGTEIWKTRKDNLLLIKNILSWTEKYKNDFDYISLCGY